jgi:hypothetical protein
MPATTSGEGFGVGGAVCAGSVSEPLMNKNVSRSALPEVICMVIWEIGFQTEQ